MKKEWLTKTLAIGIILLFICTSITPSTAFDNIKKSSIPVSNGNILYVGGSGPGNYSKIQDAIDNASDGDTIFVYNGTYGGARVDKSINLIGEDKNNTILEGSIGFDADNVKVSGFKFFGLYTGIYISNNYNNIISGNIFVGCGIELWCAGNNIISDNEIWLNQYIGIKLSEDCFNNTIINNFITQCRHSSIYFEGLPHDNIISNNYIEYTMFGIYFSSLLFHCPYDNDIIENYINSCLRGIYLRNSYGGSISNNTFIKNSIGIELERSHPEIISRNYFIENSYCGLSISGHGFNKIIQNTFMNNTQNAFFNNCFYNVWESNYWGKPRMLPYPIFGFIFFFPWVNFDWHPAQEPYDTSSIS